jgi:WS/DGAT/MGAT family acyltransferase
MKGEDAQTFYSETATSPSATVKMQFYRQVDESNPVTAKELQAAFLHVAEVSARMRMRVLRVPFGLHHPVWIEDPMYDAENHVQRVCLPYPGDKKTLCEFVGFVMSQPMDMNRPLWETWIVEGLENDQLATLTKIHHALGDGSMTAKLIAEAHRPDFDAAMAQSASRFYNPEAIPGRIRLFGEAILDLAKSYIFEFPGHLKRYFDARANMIAVTREKKGTLGAFDGPHTILNDKGSQHRTYHYEELPFGEFKSLAQQLGGTINDLVLTIISEALRQYLLERNALPQKPLVLTVPVSTRRNKETAELEVTNTIMMNNRVSHALVTFDLNIENIIDRYKSIQASSRKAVNIVRESEGRRIDDWYEFLPEAFFHALNGYLARRQRRKENPFLNTGISNVPGPREKLYFCEGRLEMTKLLSCGHLVDCVSLNATVWSYVDKLYFSFYCRKEIIPNPEELGSHMLAAYTKLKSVINQPVQKK